MTSEEAAFERERTLPLEPDAVPLALRARAPGFDGLPMGGKRVVVFYRAEWCPYCVRQLGDLEDALHEIRAAGATLVAVGADEPRTRDALVAKLGLTYPVVSDSDLLVATAWGVRQRGVKAALPATFVLDAGGRVVWCHIATNPVDRAPMAEILAALHDG